MKSVPTLKEIVSANNWKYLVKHTLPVNVADLYSFSECMHIVDALMSASSGGSFITDLMRDYSVNLMKILRAKYPHEWKKDWKNEAYLGITCGLVFREEEAFVHIKNAYKQIEDPPQSLILAYICAGSGPGQFLTKEQIASLSQQAVAKGLTYEIALRMAALADDQNDGEQQNYWSSKALESERKGIHTPVIVPNILKDTFRKERGRACEE